MKGLPISRKFISEITRYQEQLQLTGILISCFKERVSEDRPYFLYGGHSLNLLPKEKPIFFRLL